ncbi:hypothetical protein LRS13_20770 [Svornostia abyssi]|uniref:Uncharacterized protein n=1 Tax=Svornostia abyssi TaxID=2898438 RepID=A0ABY5PEI2_9ACTN|nr:hypothetical protein LRS13_20770 [Parviterribacteraceae bacterium J379]
MISRRSRDSRASIAGSHSAIVEPVPIAMTSGGPLPRSYHAIFWPSTLATRTFA